MMHRIGVISDTHGLLREEVKPFLAGCDLIVHAGDIGSAFVLQELRKIAKVTAVRGNVDTGDWAQALGPWETIGLNGKRIFVIHRLADIAMDPASEGINAVIHGHSHRADIRYGNGVLYLNPGSAGPRRFGLPVSMALMKIDAAGIFPKIVEIRA